MNPFSCRLPNETHETILRLSRVLGWTKTAVVIEALKHFALRPELKIIEQARSDLCTVEEE